MLSTKVYHQQRSKVVTLLVNPPYITELYRSSRLAAVFAPLGLAYLASYLRNAGQNVSILDANAERLNISQTVQKIKAFNPTVLGITAVTATMPLVYKICAQVKKNNQPILPASGSTAGIMRPLIVLGGPHVTFMTEKTFQECSEVDFIVRGEGEQTLSCLIETLQNGGELNPVSGLSYKKNTKILHNPNRDPIKALDALPFPALDLLPLERYKPSCILDLQPKGQQFSTIITARGCPNRCSYCSSSHFWGALRLRSVENVIDEILHLQKTYKVKRIDLLDDTATISSKRIETFCSQLLKKNIRIRWSCYARAGIINLNLAQLMKNAGCFAVQFGIESADPSVLKKINKNITLEGVQDTVRALRSAGIKVMGYFMVGLPGDNQKSIKRTVEFAKALKLNMAFFSITTPFPGTKMYQEYTELGLIPAQYAWDQMSLHNSTLYRNENLTSQEIKYHYQKAIKDFYLRPGFIYQLFWWLIKNPWDIKNYLALALAYSGL